MKKRKIGNVYVNPIGLGCMGFSHAYGPAMDEKEAIKTIQKAYVAGYNFFDTAECYLGTNQDGTLSNNEEIVGKALHDVREKVFIATKFGVKHAADNTLICDSRPETIRRSIEGSLKRLNTDYIDLYYQHRIDPNIEPEVVANTMKELIKEGKIKAWGISEVNEEYLRRANQICHVSAIQNRYSMMARWHEPLFKICDELDIAFVAFSPLANGFLGGDILNVFPKGDFRNEMPQYHEGLKAGKELLAYLNQLAKEKNCTTAQLSLAWMLNKSERIIPIPGSRNIQRIKENMAAADILLSSSEMKKIDNFLNSMQFFVFGGHKKQ